MNTRSVSYSFRGEFVVDDAGNRRIGVAFRSWPSAARSGLLVKFGGGAHVTAVGGRSRRREFDGTQMGEERMVSLRRTPES